MGKRFNILGEWSPVWSEKEDKKRGEIHKTLITGDKAGKRKVYLICRSEKTHRFLNQQSLFTKGLGIFLLCTWHGPKIRNRGWITCTPSNRKSTQTYQKQLIMKLISAKDVNFFYALNLFTKVARRNLILRRFFTSFRSFAEQKYSLTKRKMYYNVTKYCCNKIQLPVFVF